MIPRRWLAPVVGAFLLATLVLPSGTGAQLSGITVLSVPVSVRLIPAHFAGQLTVSFHGDAASGCASRGLCGYAGTVSWRPPADAALDVLTYRERGRLSYALSLLLENPNGNGGAGGGVSTASVQSAAPAGASECVDATTTARGIPLMVRGGRVAFSLAGAGESILATRCAGPLARDVETAIPIPTLPLRQVMKGEAAVSLAASGAFSSHGLAGTVQSSVTIRLGRPGRAQHLSSAPSGGRERYREVQVSYRASLAGSVVEHVRGAVNLLACAPLASCGALGTVTLVPRIENAQGELTAIAPLRRPYRDLLTALGLSRRGDASGIRVGGGVIWRGGGTIDSDVLEASTRCTDSVPLGPGEMLLSSGHRGLEAQYVPGYASTRCPGPDTAIADPILATGATPFARRPRHVIRIALTQGRRLTDYGYSARLVRHLTLTLTPVRIATHTTVSPGGSFFAL